MKQEEPDRIPNPQDMLRDFWMHQGDWALVLEKERWVFVA